MVFIQRPAIAVTKSGSDEKLAQSLYNKLTPGTLGPFPVVSVASYTLTVNKQGIHNAVTIDRASSAPNKPQERSTAQLKAPERSLATNLLDTECGQPQSPIEYPVDRTVGDDATGANIRYKVLRYG